MMKKLLFLFLLMLFTTSLETSETKIETKQSGFWTYYCKNYENERQCEIARKIQIEQQDETFLVIYKITKDINSKKKENLNIFTPSSSKVNTEKRLNISFEDKTKITKSFVECKDDSCLSVFKGDRILKYSMKNFNKMKITFYAPGENDPTSLTLPMDGFKKALEDITLELKSY